MALLKIDNVNIKGMAACVPANVEENRDYPYFDANELDRMIPTIGIERRRVLKKGNTCGDLACKAAEKLLVDLGWAKDSIDLLVFCSPDRDYILPDTACVIQGKLGLPKSTMAYDMTLGCTGWVYPMTNVCSLVSHGCIKRALLLTGNHGSWESAYTDKTAYPLFSDSGTATAVEFEEGAPTTYFQLGTDGANYEDIIIRDGGARNGVTEESLKINNYGLNIDRTRLHMEMKGMEVFAFALKTAPKSVSELLEYSQKSLEEIDCFFFHQANYYMVKKIIKKMKIDPDKAPFSMLNFGNTGASSIPFTMITERADLLRNNKLKNVGCSFGVGLSWASIYFETDHLIIPELINFE